MTTTKTMSEERRWLWAAAISAWHAAQDGEGWDDDAALCEAARFFYYRHWEGPDAVETMRAACRGEGDAGSGAYFRQPAGFHSWRKLADDLFEELDVVPDVSRLEVGSKGDWCAYHLEIVHKEDDPLFDPSGEVEPTHTFVGTIASFGSVFTPLCVVVRALLLVVADGRQRLNGVRAHNEHEIMRYYEDVENAVRYREPQRHLLHEPRDVDSIELPHLIHGVPFVVVTERKGRRIKSVANCARKHETVLDQARACWDLSDELKRDKVPEDQIAGQIAAARGVTPMTVYNFLRLRGLIKPWMALLLAGKLAATSGYKLGKEDKTRQAECHKAWLAAHAKNHVLKVDKFVASWLAGGGDAPAELVPARTKAKVYEGAARLRSKLEQDVSGGLSPDMYNVLEVLRALEDDEACDRLPPTWRVAIRGDNARNRRSPEMIEAWKELGVVDAQTVIELEDDFSFAHDDPERDVWEDGCNSASEEEAAYQRIVLRRASRLWKATAGGPRTIAWAYEYRHITLGEATKLMQAPLSALERTEVLPRHRERGAGKHEVLAGDATPPRDPFEVVSVEPRLPERRVVQAVAQRGPQKPWKDFADDERAEYEAAGVTSRGKAVVVRKAGLPVSFLHGKFRDANLMPARALDVLGDEAVTRTLGELLQAAALTPDELQGAWSGAYGPVDVDGGGESNGLTAPPCGLVDENAA
jgi:hypothetical protein